MGYSVLHNAVSIGHIDIVKTLLSDERFNDQINIKNHVSDNMVLYVTNLLTFFNIVW